MKSHARNPTQNPTQNPTPNRPEPGLISEIKKKNQNAFCCFLCSSYSRAELEILLEAAGRLRRAQKRQKRRAARVVVPQRNPAAGI